MQYLQTKLDDIKVPENTKYKPKKTQTVERVMNRAFTQVLFSGRQHIDICDVFLALLSEKKSFSTYCVVKAGVEKEAFNTYINNEFVGTAEDEEMAGHAQRALKAFTSNLNQEVVDGKMEFYGMASESAMTRHSNHNDYRGTEGKTVEVEYRGKADDSIKDILSGIRSACTYVGANKLKDLSKCTTFVRVNNTHNTVFGNE